MAKKLIVANWKLNPTSFEEADRLIKTLSRARISGPTVVICPPALYLSRFTLRKSKLLFGVQDIFTENSGAFTGEISAPMAKSVGAHFSIIGHSERRALGESNSTVSKKTSASLRAGLHTVLCVGEKERDSHGHYLSYLKAQIDESLEGVTKNQIEKLIIAYEPIWAIGTRAEGAIESRELQETVIFIHKVLHDRFGKKALSIPILYGGSVDVVNAETLVLEGRVNGLLVGRESLKAPHFLKIVSALSRR